MQPTTSRRAYLDWLRIFSILGVLVFHCTMPFSNLDSWHIMNHEKSESLTLFGFWLSRFRMPLLFFISGAVSWFMVKKRTTGSFILLRFRRLFIPLLFGMLVIVPPQIYAERLTQGFKGNYWEFYKTVFQFKPYPMGGSFSWHHLWFIFYLFVYDLVLAKFFTWSISEKGATFVRKLGWLAQGKRVYWMVLPSVLSFCGLICWFDETHDFVHDLCYDLYWFFFLLAGFLAMLQPRILDSLQRNRRYSLTAGFLLMGLLMYMHVEHIQISSLFSHPLQNPFFFASLSVYPLVAWTWVFAAIGYGKQYLDKTSRVLNYINQAVYPFYILHQTIIVVLAYFVVRWSDGIGMKYSFLVATTFFITMGIYHLFICRIPVLRFLFGMKASKDVRPAPHTSAPNADTPTPALESGRTSAPAHDSKIPQPILQGSL